MTLETKKTAKEIKLELALLLDLYNAKELEETVFDIFNEDSKRESLTTPEREQRAFLHKTLRHILRTIDQNPETLNQLQS